MSDRRNQLIPVLTPPVAFLGKKQKIVIECAKEFPHNNVTVDLLDKGESRGFLNRQTATVLGPRTCRIELPVLCSEGEYLLMLKFNSTKDKSFPEIPLRVLSPLEAMQHCIPVSSEHIEKPPMLAAVVAYLIQCGRIGKKESPIVGDEMLCEILQCMYAKRLPIMSVPGFLCDRYYGGYETLLHFALRLQLQQTCSFLLTDDIITNYKGLLQLQGYDKKQPLEIARGKGLSTLSDRILELTVQYVVFNPQDRSPQETTDGGQESSNWEKQQAGEEAKKQVASSDESSTTRSKLLFLSKTRLGQMLGGRRYTQPPKVVAKVSEENLEQSEAAYTENPAAKSSSKQRSLTQERSVDELKQNCLYKKMIITEYVALDEANNPTRLQAGDIAHVVEEFRMCKGVVNNVYCQFPLVILSPLQQDKKPHQKPQQDTVDDGREYEEMTYDLKPKDDGGRGYAALVQDTLLDDQEYEVLDVTTMNLLPGKTRNVTADHS